MKLCPTCHRHLRAPEARCPFCGAEQRSTPSAVFGPGLIVSLLLSAMLSACTERLPGDTDTTTDTPVTGTTTTDVTPTTVGPVPTTGPDGTTTAPTPTTDGSVSSSDPVDSTGDPGCSFYAGCPPDFGTLEPACDVFAQDCPEGEKCSAYASNGATFWNNTKCVPAGTQAPGQSCTAEGGGISGIDDCQLGAMCWDTDGGSQGTCVALCTGTEDKPVCAADDACAIANEGVLNLCLPVCDPLAQDCADDEVCVAIGEVFVCIDDDSGDTGVANDPCTALNACDQGLACVSQDAAIECPPQTGCCQPFCDTTDPDPMCPNPDQACVPWFAAMMQDPPPGLEKIGFCSIPPP